MKQASTTVNIFYGNKLLDCCSLIAFRHSIRSSCWYKLGYRPMIAAPAITVAAKARPTKLFPAALVGPGLGAGVIEDGSAVGLLVTSGFSTTLAYIVSKAVSVSKVVVALGPVATVVPLLPTVSSKYTEYK